MYSGFQIYWLEKLYDSTNTKLFTAWGATEKSTIPIYTSLQGALGADSATSTRAVYS